MASPDEEGAQRPPKRRRSLNAPAGPQVARVVLNPADCNLDFDVGGGGLQGQGLHNGGFAYCWSGARATVGVRGGRKYCFGCKIVAKQDVVMEDTAADQRHICRVGVSMGDEPVGALGETDHSFGFEGTGKFSHQGKPVEYGVKFGVGDTVVCAVDLDSKPMASIGLSRNGEWFGIAKHFDASDKGLGLLGPHVSPMQWESAIFPHILLKNVVVEMQFSREDGLGPVDGYEPWSSAYADGNAVLGPVFAEQRGCHVLMMVGLPASGKSTWAEKWTKEHKEMRYIVLGTIPALEQKKVPQLLCRNYYGERFERLMDWGTLIFNTLLARAAKIPRNYIIDQTNLYRSTRIRKLMPFPNYRKIAVVVFPLPSELKARAAKRFKETGKVVPADAVNEMAANFVLPLSKGMPGSNEPFDKVTFVELSRDEAQRNLDEMKRLMPRASVPRHANLNNQNAISTNAGTVSPAVSATIAPSLSGVHPQMGMQYGGRVQTVGALTHQHAAGTSQHQIQPSHPSNPYQHQIQSSNLSNPNQRQIHPCYPTSTSCPVHGPNGSCSNSGPIQYVPNTCNMNTEMQQRMLASKGGTNLSNTHVSTGASNSVGRPIYAHPPAGAVYGSGNDMLRMQHHAHGEHSAGSQTSAPATRPAKLLIRPHVPNQANQPPAANQTNRPPAPNQKNRPPAPNQTNRHPAPNQTNRPPAPNQMNRPPAPNQTNRPPFFTF